MSFVLTKSISNRESLLWFLAERQFSKASAKFLPKMGLGPPRVWGWLQKPSKGARGTLRSF